MENNFIEPVIETVANEAKKTKGRPTLPGTHEAREFVRNGEFEKLILTSNLSKEAINRIIYAINFALGIKK